MKTAWSSLKSAFAALLLVAAVLEASWNISADIDLRYRLSEWQHHDGGLHVAGASVRKTFSDRKGDRLTLFGLVEAHDNFSMVMAHELYGLYKGPLGSWNVSVGRFGLPYGLLTGFSASRLLYTMPHHELLGYDVDNGIMLSGVRGMLDYGISVTQGYGPHHLPDFSGHGLATGRLGFTLGDAGETIVGVSGVYGTTAHAHDRDMTIDRALGALDMTMYLGRLLCRAELSGGMVNSKLIGAGFVAIDYALLPRLDVNLGITGVRNGTETHDAWFTGVTHTSRWFTLRGGYQYAYYNEPHHQVAVQLYRLFAANF